MILILIIKTKLFHNISLESEIKATNNLEEALMDMGLFINYYSTQFVKNIRTSKTINKEKRLQL